MHDEPVLVTTAPVSPNDERRTRERRYLITMAIRVVAIVVAIVVPGAIWIRVIAVTLALVLPWIAVVFANSGPARPSNKAPELYTGTRVLEISDKKADD